MITEQINEGLDRAVMTMKRGEQAVVTVNSENVDSNDVSGIAKEERFYEVELIDFIKVLCSYCSPWKLKFKSLLQFDYRFL